MNPPDEIRIAGLKLATHIGVPDAERAVPQTLEADIVIRVAGRFETIQDDISATIDYAAVADRLQNLAASKPRQLIETLAAELAECVLNEFKAEGVTVDLRKRILPQTDHVAVRVVRWA